jgi:hypothetical protein
MKWRLSARLAALLLLGCTIRDKKPPPLPPADPYAGTYRQVDSAKALLHEGDLILRNGLEFSSQVVKQFNRKDKSFSHAGIILFRGSEPFVYHIVPGDENPDLRLRFDSLERFCNPRRNGGFALYRYALDSTEILTLKETILGWHRAGVLFDSTFNLQTDDRMYCSEMIKKGLARASGNRIIIATTKPTPEESAFFASNLRAPLSYVRSLQLVAIDDLFLNPHCRLVRRFNYQYQP